MIDARKKTQHFANKHGHRIYCWKEAGGFAVGINGTSKHYAPMPKHQAEDKIRELQNYQMKKFVFDY